MNKFVKTAALHNLGCKVNAYELERIGEDVIRRLKIVPAKYVVVETHIQKYIEII